MSAKYKAPFQFEKFQRLYFDMIFDNSVKNGVLLPELIQVFTQKKIMKSNDEMITDAFETRKQMLNILRVQFEVAKENPDFHHGGKPNFFRKLIDIKPKKVENAKFVGAEITYGIQVSNLRGCYEY